MKVSPDTSRKKQIPSNVLPALCAALLFSACGDPESEQGGHTINPDEIDKIINTSDHDKALVLMAIEAISLQENYTPENFEDRQKKGIALMTSTHRKAVEDYLPTRVQEIQDAKITSRFEPDLESAVLKKMKFGESIRAQLKISGTKYMTLDGKEYPPREENHTVNYIVHGLDEYEINTIGTK